MEKTIEEPMIVESNGKKYIGVHLTMFHDLPTESKYETLLNNFGLKEVYVSKKFYEIVDEKKFMLTKIKYGI